ncbi:AbrB/MazE/SpoVT family DNA-binding domain-containing protein [Pantoea sp. Al-1710]|uniref:AbrB/MazE/SpoVT family DNA-binding domain-containing protein n=1 Tax=Candidatus Pantoea communis TaxID=2608354 RepID=A0ABX0RKN3_9GAMM|nr:MULTISPECIES: AbrB/MazE/SpoVT family DNA-binding domain-containing protein [Pantoea]NIG12942.1 AbrB/MazE/SpoVT family DNA-binding domain-containing protein [Pantoea sp. Cy-640]NIG17357.1 AbrB/MazE/SpoVT family DNA-binding domain-containing protein [Pantoea communis]
MQTIKLRQQGGAIIFTIPSHTVKRYGLSVGDSIALEEHDLSFEVRSLKSKHIPRGSFTVSELLKTIDQDEIEHLNASVKGFGEDKVGNEAW